MKKSKQQQLRRTFFNRQATVLKWNKRKMFRKLREAGVAEDVQELLGKVWGKTVGVGRFIYQTGKVIVYEFLRLLKRHPGLVAGITAASALTFMVAKIPFVGHFLAPYVALISFPLFGYIGLKLDMDKNNLTGKQIMKVLKDFIESLRNIILSIYPAGAEERMIPVLA